MFGEVSYWKLVLNKTTRNLRKTERFAGRLCSLMFGEVLHWQLLLKKTMRDFIIIEEDL
jgi:hypothetical protein